MVNSRTRQRTGRRPGPTATRDEILAAARAEFTDRAYAGATIRGIAARAAVDPALVLHYFGSKRELFLAALELPFDPGGLARAALAGDPETAGERLLLAALAAWDTTADRSPVIALIRSAMADDATARMLREYVRDELLAPALQQAGSDQPDVRAGLLGAQMIGLIVVRYIVRLEPIASMPRERLAALLAPQVQQLLHGALPRAWKETGNA